MIVARYASSVAHKKSKLESHARSAKSTRVENNDSVSPLVAALFAAEQIAKPGKLDGVHIAGSQAKVSTADLAPKILAFAFLRLRDDGAITLETASKKVLFVTSTWVAVHRTGTPSESLGAATASLCSFVRDGKSVRDAIYAWYESDQRNPWPLPIQVATREAISAGYLVASEQKLGGKIGSFFTGAMPTAIAAGKEDEVRAIGAAAAAKWSEYQKQDSALVELLVKQCSSAISGRQEQTEVNT
jgi:hypothetical protein